MDKVGNKTAQLEIAMIKVPQPRAMALTIIDDAMQGLGRRRRVGGSGSCPGLRLDSAPCALPTVPTRWHNRAIAPLGRSPGTGKLHTIEDDGGALNAPLFTRVKCDKMDLLTQEGAAMAEADSRDEEFSGTKEVEERQSLSTRPTSTPG